MTVGELAGLVRITGLYAGVCGLLLIGLSGLAIRLRVRNRISLGDGGNVLLQRAIRAQGNFIEYVPIALLLMLLLELGRASPAMLHGLGMTLLLGRVIHAISLYRAIGRLRVAGQFLTFVVIAAGAVALLHRFLA